MATFEKTGGGGTSGAWAKASEIASGTKVKFITEATSQTSDYGPQTVVKARFQGGAEALNVRLNKPTVNGLIDAFGKESKGWIGHVLTAITEKAIVSGKRVTILYIVPDGYELSEDGGGFLTITPKTKEVALERPRVVGPKNFEEEIPEIEDALPGDDVNSDDIPW